MAARFCFAEAGRFFNSPYVTIPPGLSDLARCFGAELHLSQFFLQGPISAFVGTTGIGTKYEDVPFAENLGCGTCRVLVSPSTRGQAPD